MHVADGTYSGNIIISKPLTLLSANGRGSTAIEGNQGGSELGTVVVTPNTDHVQIGDTGQGFTIIGIDGPPGIEKAAVYFQGDHSDVVVRGNNIIANGDAGLMAEYGATISGFVISGNEFSGQTFAGDTPGGDGFSEQFTTANVPRQLVVMGGGPGGGNTSNVTFSDNVVSGIAGGVNADGKPQGNTLVTIDSNGSTISGNVFEGRTTRYGTSLRARGPNATISGNDFRSTYLTLTCGHIYLQNNALDADLVGANTFDKGVYVESASGGTIGLSIQGFVDAVPASTTINVLAGTYSESLGGWRDLQIFKSLNLIGAGSGQTIVELTGLQHGVEIRGTNANVLLEGLTLTKADGAARSAGWAILVGETGGSFDSLTFRDVEVAWAEARNVHLANAIYENVVIEDCNFHDAGAWGFSARGTIKAMTVSNSSFDDNGWADAAHGIGFDIDMPHDVSNITVVGGSFSRNTAKGINLVAVTNATFDGITAEDNGGAPGGGFGVSLWEWQSASSGLIFRNSSFSRNTLDGFLFGTEGATTISNVEITRCCINDNGRHGVHFYHDFGGSVSSIAVVGNSLTGNIGKGIGTSALTTVIDGRNNWWGSAVPAEVAAEVGASVDYSPWLQTDPGCPVPSFALPEGPALVVDAIPESVVGGQEFVASVYVVPGTYEVFGFQFTLEFDPSVLLTDVQPGEFLEGLTMLDIGGSTGEGGYTWLVDGSQVHVSLLDDALNSVQGIKGAAAEVAKVTFRAVEPGPCVDDSDLTLSGEKLVEKEDAREIPDVQVYPDSISTYSPVPVSGVVELQGRSDWTGATVSLAGSPFSYAGIVTDSAGAWSANVACGTYDVYVDMNAYLDAESKSAAILSAWNRMVKLLGGNADETPTTSENRIFLEDVVAIANVIGLPAPTPSNYKYPDINADGTINILDLVLAGINYTEEGPKGY